MKTTYSTNLSLFDLFHQLVRHWKLGGVFFLASMLVTLVAWWFVPRNYRSESKLYIRPGRESAALDPTATIGRAMPAQPQLSPRENEVNSVTEILQSRVLLEQVGDVVGPDSILSGMEVDSSATDANDAPAATASVAGPSSEGTRIAGVALDENWPRRPNRRDRAIVRLQTLIQVPAVKKSDVVHVSCDTNSPRLSQKIVAHLVEFYLAEHLRLNRAPGAYEFLQRQTAEMQDKLMRAEDELRKLKDDTGLASPEVQRDLMVKRAGQLEDELFTAAATLASTEAEVRALREKLATLPKTRITGTMLSVPNHDADLMRNELYRLQITEQELTSRFTDEHFAVKQARQRTAEAKKILDAQEDAHDQVTHGPNVVYEQTELAIFKQEPLLTSLRAKTDTLRSQLAQVHEDLKAFNAHEMQIAQLTRDHKQHEANYRAYAEHLEQTRIDQALELGRISSISIIQPATFEPKPVGPKDTLIFGLGLFVGLIGAIGLPLIVASIEASPKNPHDLETRLGVPVLASIPRFKAEQLPGNGVNS